MITPKRHTEGQIYVIVYHFVRTQYQSDTALLPHTHTLIYTHTYTYTLINE